MQKSLSSFYQNSYIVIHIPLQIVFQLVMRIMKHIEQGRKAKQMIDLTREIVRIIVGSYNCEAYLHNCQKLTGALRIVSISWQKNGKKILATSRSKKINNGAAGLYFVWTHCTTKFPSAFRENWFNLMRLELIMMFRKLCLVTMLRYGNNVNNWTTIKARKVHKTIKVLKKIATCDSWSRSQRLHWILNIARNKI